MTTVITTTTVNLSRPGQAPQDGDWVRDTTTLNGAVLSVLDHEFHAPPPPEEPQP